MSTIPLNDSTPRVQYTAAAGQTVFIYPFWVTHGADLNVYIEGNLLEASSFTTSGILNPTGGNVTLLTPAAEGQIVTIERNIPFERVSEFQEGGTFKASILNLELSKQLAMMQQLKRDIQRKIGLSPTSSVSVPNLTLPDPVDGKALVFDGTDGRLRASVANIDNLDNALTTANTAASTATAAASTANTAASTATAAQTAAEAARDVALANIGNAKITAADTTPAKLDDKLTVSGIAVKSIVNPAGDEDLNIDVPVATQAEAEAGTSATVAMTPLSAQQHLAANGFFKVNKSTFSNAATLDLTNLNPAAYQYIFVLDKIIPVSSGQGIVAQLSVDNGATFISSADYFAQFRQITGSVDTDATTAALTQLPLGNGITGVSNDPVLGGFSGVLKSFLHDGTHRPRFRTEYQYVNTTPADVEGVANLFTTTTSALASNMWNAIRFFAFSGNFSGTITTYAREV